MTADGTTPDNAAPSGSVNVRMERGVATVTYAERRLNLVGSAGLDAIVAALEGLATREGLRLAVVTGAGERAFIGGADIREMASLDPVSAQAFITRIHQANHALRTLPVPSIARIRGYCLGAGMELAASCDLRIADEDAVFGMPEVQVGLPSVVEAALLPSLIGWGKTRELLYTGRTIDAAEAERIGFVQRVAPAVELDAALGEWVEAILAADPAAVRAQKRLIEGWLETGPAAGVRAGIDAFRETYRTDAPNRRLQAFLERSRKRPKA